MAEKLLREFKISKDSSTKKNIFSNTLLNKDLFLIAIIGIFMGVLTSIFIFNLKSTNPSLNTISKTKKITKNAGVKDPKLFPDSTEGVLKEGGIEGEGSFHLERPGGASQNVYLTSSTIDLSQFVGKRVKVWGKTYKGEKAGWLMDVGYLEVIE